MNNTVHEPSEWAFDRVGVRGKPFASDYLADHIEFLLIETAHGHETTIRQRDSDFVYYVLNGHGEFVIDGDTQEVSQGDLVVIPHGSAFTYEGGLRMLLVVTPRWTAEQETVVGDRRT